jgi:hypothetical protein
LLHVSSFQYLCFFFFIIVDVLIDMSRVHIALYVMLTVVALVSCGT